MLVSASLCVCGFVSRYAFQCAAIILSFIIARLILHVRKKRIKSQLPHSDQPHLVSHILMCTHVRSIRSHWSLKSHQMRWSLSSNLAKRKTKRTIFQLQRFQLIFNECTTFSLLELFCTHQHWMLVRKIKTRLLFIFYISFVGVWSCVIGREVVQNLRCSQNESQMAHTKPIH